jgi:hypothetical protein
MYQLVSIGKNEKITGSYQIGKMLYEQLLSCSKNEIYFFLLESELRPFRLLIDDLSLGMIEK